MMNLRGGGKLFKKDPHTANKANYHLELKKLVPARISTISLKIVVVVVVYLMSTLSPLQVEEIF